MKRNANGNGSVRKISVARDGKTYDCFKRIVKSIGMETMLFHDLRHSYAVASIKNGDDIKTVQENLGHATAAFTLDVYVHATNQMKKASADRMEQYIQNLQGE